MTMGSPASSTATHEFVVPRSIPMTRPTLDDYTPLPAALALYLADRALRELEVGIELERTLKLE